MPLPRSPYRLAALTLVAVIAVASLYRAATQSFVHDEALTFQLFLDGPWSLLTDHYDANHHVLNTLLEKVSMTVLGSSELALRLPSLLGGVLYLAASYRVVLALFGDTVWLPLMLGMLGLQPLVFDFLSAARGYGMGLGFLMLALFLGLRFAGTRRPRALYWLGAAMGLSVSANLTYVFPCAGMMAALMIRLRRPLAPQVAPRKKRRDPAPPAVGSAGILLRAGGTAAAMLVLIAAEPLSHARREDFYVGADSLYASVRSLAMGSFFHPPQWAVAEAWAGPLAILAGILVFAGAALLLRRGDDAGEWIVAGSALSTLVLVLAAHYLAGVNFPEGRTALYWVAIGELTMMLAARRYLPKAGIAAAAVLVLVYAAQWNTRFYAVWRYDAGTRAAMEIIQDRQSAQPHEPVRIGATWLLEPALNYYRTRFGMEASQPISRQGPEGYYDFYLLLPPDHKLVKYYGLKVLRSDDLAETILAMR